MKKAAKALAFLFVVCFLSAGHQTSFAQEREMIEHPAVRLRSLDKITARTRTFEAEVGQTLKFGSLYIKVQTCKKAAPVEQPESAAFLQIWEHETGKDPEWVFSGWMFASSPALSAMDHPIYDVWVLDCLKVESVPEENEAENDERGEGIVDEQQQETLLDIP